MKRFAELFARLDATTRTSEKVEAMVAYFRDVDPRDGAWAVYFLSGGRPKRLIPVRRLAEWARALADIPEWLFEESYHAVGDLAETIALLLPDPTDESAVPLHQWVEQRLLTIGALDEEAQRALIEETWRSLAGMERFVGNKLITGNFRIGVSRQLVTRALAQASGVDEGTIAHRLSGTWTPTAEAFRALFSAEGAQGNVSRPYPFFLAYPLEGDLDSLGDPAAWQAEWKWDGIRAQVIRRSSQTFIWSRGEELVTDRFPELSDAALLLPEGTVIDGELLPWRDGAPMPFAQLQRRIGRTKLGPKILADVPVALVAYDLLELNGDDVRDRPLAWRRDQLATIVRGLERILLSPTIEFTSWADLAREQETARDRLAEGMMLKERSAPYGVGRRKGGWWKWKIAPYTADAVLVYAQAGHGRRALLHTDYTFAVWDGDALVPFAKAYSGLTDAEIRQLDAWIRRNTVEKFGPVRSVTPHHVFELAFEGIQASPRHKSGIAVRFPRITRWRTDKTPADADTLDTLRALMRGEATS